MVFEEIKNLLQKNIGLHSGSIGDSSIVRAISHRMNNLGISDENHYLTMVISDQDEMDELVEEVVVPETWFFRNLVPFETLSRCIPELDKSQKDTISPIRILSIPCSTGEEPYSIAITLLRSGVPEGRFLIDAVDISKRAITKARRAIYGKHSFRESDGNTDPRYFKATRSGQQLLPIVKDHVNFIKGNILKDIIAPEPEYYDIIFCRNLLIYFNKETQKAVLEKLNIILKGNGTLFLGHAETTESCKGLFSRLDVPRAFAFRKFSNSQPAVANQLAKQPVEKLEDIYNQLVNVTLKDIELSRKHKAIYSQKHKSDVNSEISSDVPKHLNVEKLIEQGHLSAASTLCEKWLEDQPDEAQCYYFLGLISSLEGNAGSADALLKKAIYLDPNHHKALGLSALLAEQRGDRTTADSLRFRELRARKRVQ
ncbi:CheR family methyltransferase [Kaarinaea lacus]